MPITYATLADMQARYRPADLVQLSDWDDTGVLDVVRIETALAKAGTIIDGYVAARHGDRSGLPVSPLLTELACDIGYYELHRAGVPDKVEKQRDRAMATLRDIATGKVRLDDGIIDSLPERPGAIHSASSRRFGRADLDAY